MFRELVYVVSLCACFGLTHLAAQTIETRQFRSDLGTMQYRLYLPEGYDQPGKEFPVVMWLHGGGAARFNIRNRPQSLVESLAAEPYAAVLIEPLANTLWHTCDLAQPGGTHLYCVPGLTQDMELALGVLEEVESLYPIDATRRVVTGYSSGAVASFSVALERPGYFSAAVPIQAGHDPRRFRHPVKTRLWTMHGHDDAWVPPLYTSGVVETLSKLGESSVYLEPPGNHSAPFMDTFFEDADNELYPWMFEGVEPSLARLIYNPATGGVQVDASSAPGGMISRMEISPSAGRNFSQPAISEINGDAVSFSDGGVIEYTASDGVGFGGVIDLGEILPPGMNLTQLHGSLFRFNYDSPAATQQKKTFRVVTAPSDESPLLGEVVEEPWVVYQMASNGNLNDLGLATTTNIGKRGRRDDQRVLAKFQLPELPDGTERLDQASLRLYFQRFFGKDDSYATVWHGLTDNDHEQLASDYADEAYVSTELSIVSSADFSDEFYEVDITDFVLADYANDSGPPVSSFRLQVSGREGSAGDAQFRFAMPRDRSYFPQLILSFLPELDCNGDGVIDVADANCASFATLDSILAEAGLIPGDADGNREVQFSDFTILADNFGKAGQYTDGDFDKDGTVQFGDFLILASNFGQVAAATQTVPEPGSGWLLVFGSLLLSVRRKSP